MKTETQIGKKDLDKLESFIGYGRKDAEVIFFGIEEAGGGLKNLQSRLRIQDYQYLDCKRFHLDHLEHLKPYTLHSDDPEKAVHLQQVWKFMSYIMLRLENREDHEIFRGNSKLLREYQNNRLGSKTEKGNTLLTEIYPIPCSNFACWGTKEECYKEIIPHYENGKKEYKKEVIGKRIELFKEIMLSNEFRAKSIICYGRSQWNEYKTFFKHFDVEFQEMKLSKRAEIGKLMNGTKIFLIPFLGNGQVSYSFLDELTNQIKEKEVELV